MEPRGQVPAWQRGVEGPGPAESGLPRASTEGSQLAEEGRPRPALRLFSQCVQDGREAGHSRKNESYSALNETRNQPDLLTGWMWRKDASPVCPVGGQTATS